MLELDVNSLHGMTGVVEGFVADMNSNIFLPALMNYAYQVMAESFGTTADALAQSGDSIDHMYEWNVPAKQGRLWASQMSGRGKRKDITFTFLPSKTYVPVPDELLEPGPTNRAVKADSHIFKQKALVMELGLQVTIRPKNAKYLAFLPEPVEYNEDGTARIVFTNRSVTNVPGREVAGNFTLLFNSWWQTEAPSVFEERVAPNVGRDLSKLIEKNVERQGKRQIVGFAAGGFSANEATRKRAKKSTQADIRKLARQYERRTNG